MSFPARSVGCPQAPCFSVILSIAAVALWLFPPFVGQGLAQQLPEAEGPQAEALRTVDRLVDAFNSQDREALVASFTPDATVFLFNWLTEDFRPGVHAALHYFTWEPPWAFRLEVVGQVASGSFVFQRERLDYTRPDGQTRTMFRAALYNVRDGRVQSVRQLPGEPEVGFVPILASPAFPVGEGPPVAFDVAHFNHHKPELSYWPFVELLRRDGYVVGSWSTTFRKAALDSSGVNVLVIANATSQKNAQEMIGSWELPTPSAFTAEEVTELEAWVRDGGSLLLIADHMPWGGAAAPLAAAFGVEFHNGLARDSAGPPPDIFSRGSGTLLDHPITRGWSPDGRVEAVATFVGQAFRPLPSLGERTKLEPLLVLPQSAVLVQPEVMGRVTEETPRIAVGGWWQGVAGTHGSGRIALFGEAAMFRVLTQEAGLPAATHNARLVRNTIRWLADAR